MASEINLLNVRLLEAIFGPSIPTNQAAILPAIMGHIRAIDDLLQGKPKQHKRISDPAISGPINSRIVDLYAEHGKSWPKIAAAICQEFGVSISPDACRGRYKDAMERKTAVTMQQEAYAALSGQAIDKPDHNVDANKLVRTSPEPEKLPTDLPTDCQPNNECGNINCRDGAGRQEDCAALCSAADRNVPESSAVATKSPFGDYETEMAAHKAEVLARHARGEGVKNIAEALGVRWQWVRAICAKAPKPEPSSAIIREQPAPVVPLNAMDARIQEMAEQGAMVHEICIAINRNFNHNYSTAEMAEKIRKLQGGANASR